MCVGLGCGEILVGVWIGTEKSGEMKNDVIHHQRTDLPQHTSPPKISSQPEPTTTKLLVDYLGTRKRTLERLLSRLASWGPTSSWHLLSLVVLNRVVRCTGVPWFKFGRGSKVQTKSPWTSRNVLQRLVCGMCIISS